MIILKFLKRKRKRILYFLVGMFFSLFTILNCFFSVEASEEDYKSYSTIYGQFKTDGYNSQGAFIYKNSESLLNQYLLAFQNNYMDSNVNWIYKDSVFNFINIQGGSNSLLSYDILSEHNNLNDFCIVSYQWDGKQGFMFYSKYNFSIKLSVFDCDTSPTYTNNPRETITPHYDSTNQLYYYSFFYYSIPEGSMASCYILNSPSSDGSDIVQTAVDYFNNNDMTKVLNSDFISYINSSANQSFYDNNKYYNGYLKNFSVSWSPLVPEVASIYEVNEITFEDQKIHLTYDPVQTQINKINEFSINAKYTYGLQIKFYGYNMDSVSSYRDSAIAIANELNPDKAYKFADAYNNSLYQYINTLNKMGFTVIESNRTWQFIEYTARFNFSVNRVHSINRSGLNILPVKDLFNSYQLNCLNALTTNICGITNPYQYNGLSYSGSNNFMTGEQLADMIRNSTFLDDSMINVPISIISNDDKIGIGEVEEVTINGFGTATGLIGQVFVVDNTLQCDYEMNTNKDSKMTYKFDFVSGSGFVISDTISTKPANNPSINKDNQVINNKDTDINFSGGGSGGSGVPGGSGGSSSSSSNSSGGNASATANSGGNTQNVNVQNGLDWNTKPVTGSNINVAQGITNGTSVITQMVNSNGFMPIISAWFSFVPNDFWQLLITVFSIIMMLIIFKFIIWII